MTNTPDSTDVAGSEFAGSEFAGSEFAGSEFAVSDVVVDEGHADVLATQVPNALIDELSDRLRALRSLSLADDESGTTAVLDEFGARGKVEQEIVKELAALNPLFMPHRFPAAHHMVMRSLEVLDRNGARSAKMPKMGPLTPVGSFLVQLVSRFIVRNHQAEVITQIRNLYVRREANSPRDSAERRMLRWARMDAERMLPTLKKNPLGVPTFLLGGAVISWVSSALGGAIQGAKSKTGLLILLGLLFLMLVGVTWAILRGSAVARNRIHMSLDAPLKALWETIGKAGNPPKDSARQFALIAIILTGVLFILVPVGLAIAVFR